MTEQITYLVANYNNGKYIKDCVDSLYAQTNPNWLCIIADDHSTDNSPEIIAPLLNEKIALLVNEQNLGYIGALKKLIEHASTDIIAILDADDALYPETTECLLQAYANNPGAGFVYSRLARFDESLTTCLGYMGGETPPDKTSLQQGMIGHIKSFRVSVYRKTGGLDDIMLYAEDRDLVYKLEEVTPPVFIDQVLYKWRQVPASQSHDKKKKEIGYHHHYRAKTNALARRGIRGFEKFFYQLFFVGEYLLFSDRWPHRLNEMIIFYLRRLDAIDALFKIRTTGKLMRSTPQKRLAYYLWRYPVLSQTFIQREIATLQKAGLALAVLADAPDNSDVLDEDTRRLAQATHYLLPWRKTTLVKFCLYFFCKKPRRFLRQISYVRSHHYHQRKTITEDAKIFLKAVYLAGTLRAKRIAQAHCPWADVNGFVLMIAAALLGIPYTLQARAQEIYRKGAQLGLAEKLRHARFIITNCHFNTAYLQSFLPAPQRTPIHVIYEGLPLEKFVANGRRKNPLRPARILSVGRLIECKGFSYLLGACCILRERGCVFRCDIIGGPEEPLYAAYHRELKDLHRQLGLEDRVFFGGAQPFSQVLAAYQNADIFVLPCQTIADGTQDITPNSLMEAMAMQLPVISTAQTAIPEMIESGESGLLIPPKDEYALAEAIIKLIDDETLRQQLGEKARRKAEQCFDIQKNTQQYAKLFLNQCG